MGFFDKLKKINIFANFGSELTDDFYDELEESLILVIQRNICKFLF